MCGRFALTLPHDAVLDVLRAQPSPRLTERLGNLGPRWNVCPTTDIPVVLNHGGERLLAPLRWGFIPRWYKTPSGGPLLINARSETIAAKPAFRSACRERRCLIPATGFYEWREEDGRKQPFRIRPAAGPPEGSLFAFAGVWETWRAPDGGRIPACAIVTGPGAFALAHNVRAREEVEPLLSRLVAAGGALLRPADAPPHGGFRGYVADPDGHAWEIAWNPAWPIDTEGRTAFAS